MGSSCARKLAYEGPEVAFPHLKPRTRDTRGSYVESDYQMDGSDRLW